MSMTRIDKYLVFLLFAGSGLLAGLYLDPHLCLAASAENAYTEQNIAEILPYKYQGNLISRKFHRPRCPFAKVMSASKKIRFHFRYQAIAQGYCPCRYCLPPTWTSVSGAIKANCLNNTPLGTAVESPNISSP